MMPALKEHEPQAIGIVQATECGDAKKPFTVAIANEGKARTFYHQGGFVWGFSDTLWFGEDHVTLCHHLEGKRAVIFYRPLVDKSFTRELLSLEIRDDIPPPSPVTTAAVPPNP